MLAALQADGGVTAALCLADDRTSSPWADARPDPEPGQGYYYLARAQNACGDGTWGYGRTPTAACP